MSFAFKVILKRNIYSFLLLVLFIIPVNSFAQGDGLNAHPALWKVEQGSSQIYFLGSIHLLPGDVKWYGDSIEEILETADEVVFEVDMTPEKEAHAQRLTLANGLLAGGDLLSNYLTEEEYSYLIEQAIIAGIPSAAIANFKPWFASIALSVSAIIREGWDPNSGVDKHIQKVARENNIKISALETLEEQLATLYDHPLDVQATMLKDTLEQLKDIRSITMEMVGSWTSGDEDKMREIFIEPMKEQPELFAKLVVKRNNNWLPVIEELIEKNQTTFVVAGAAHFIGDEGVINLLRQKGYDVVRVQ
ncbi:MAG: TraB/GumN family protein [Kordiimonadaceae bacterium]|nr:TraB/GumN family protein [Kordiimonadaceae bacterium]MBT6036746.1 TraB/GumN family protein [Kordiimonadaceae bacterium]MBT6328374.1 TraB/GumN family protein [Kordiimonadaceae bacterium]MBT7583815.1 TraB/GumN family protein [Kordiimonadaceae bacterium]